MDFPNTHLASHADAELLALTQALALQRLGNLLGCLEKHLGESVIFDPSAKIQEQVIRDGIEIGRSLCRYMVAEAEKKGLGPAPIEDRWQDLMEAALTHKANQQQKET